MWPVTGMRREAGLIEAVWAQREVLEALHGMIVEPSIQG